MVGLRLILVSYRCLYLENNFDFYERTVQLDLTSSRVDSVICNFATLSVTLSTGLVLVLFYARTRYTTRYLLNKAVVVDDDDDLCSSILPKVVALCRFALNQYQSFLDPGFYAVGSGLQVLDSGFLFSKTLVPDSNH